MSGVRCEHDLSDDTVHLDHELTRCVPSEPGDRHAGEEFLRAVDEVEMLTRLISTAPNFRWISSLVTGGSAPPEVRAPMPHRRR
jgi:hypothetical protein